jgi:hypothetical protein
MIVGDFSTLQSHSSKVFTMTTVDHHQENHSSSRTFDSHVAKIILDEGSGVESGFHTDSTCTEEGSETPGSMDMS